MASTKRYYVFYYEHEHLWGDPKRRRVRVSKSGPKEYMGPFNTKAAAERALSKDARSYKTPRTDYRVKLLTPAGFARAWG